jgi:hypothetical protein
MTALDLAEAEALAAALAIMPDTPVAPDPSTPSPELPADGLDSGGAPAWSPEQVAAEVARAAAELSELVEHHRREISDAMAELTRLQRQLRAETLAAIEQLRALAAEIP